MEKQIKIAACIRERFGTAESKRMRHEGWLPGVIYSEGQPTKSIQVKEHDFATAIRHHTSESVIVDLDVAGEASRTALLRDVQHHPISGDILHVDFHETSMTKKLKVAVPVMLVGEPLGVSQQGGVLEHLIQTVDVEFLPADLIEHIDVDVSELEVGQRLRVSDIQLDPEKYTVLTAGDIALASVSAPRVEEASESTETDAKQSAEPEVIGENREESAEKAS
ncbi:MAG: 50S ribosomal protein L25 [Kiritimatiellae bacterium]|nr:50S ribosomal protein L25 [Kiritimatiellia bacterium]